MTPARGEDGRRRATPGGSSGGSGPRSKGGASDSPRSPSGTRRSPAPRPFRYPVGVEMIEGENYRQREGYDVIYLKDDDSPRYQYTIAAGADRTAEVFGALAGLLPEKVRGVLEIPGEPPGPDGDGRDCCDVWMGPPVERAALTGAFDSHERLFAHDGMVGIGAVSPDGTTEVFLDEHKLIYFYAPEMDGADEALAALGIPARSVVRHFSELGHVHTSLSSKGAGEVYWEVADDLKRTLGLEWEETKKYT